MVEKSQAIQDLWDKENKDEDYKLSEDEREEVLALTKNLEELKGKRSEVEASIELEQQVKATQRELGPQFSSFDRDVQVVEPTEQEVKSLGEQFIEQKGYKDFLEKGFQSSSWQKMGDLDTKATLFSSPGTALT